MVRLVVGDGHPVEVLREQPCVLVVCGSLVVGCCLARHDLVLIPLSRLALVWGWCAGPVLGLVWWVWWGLVGCGLVVG